MKPAAAIIGFVAFWSIITLLFDWFTLVPVARQLAALGYPSTEGTIQSSKVSESDSDDGTVYGVSVRYTYTAGGQEYTGTRYRYGSGFSDSEWAHNVIADWPPGAEVRVFYDPKNPQNSVLTTGLLGSDLVIPTFMTPFNAVMIGLWWAGCARLRQVRSKPLAGGVKITMHQGETRIRLTGWSPVAVSLAAIGFLAFCSVFVVGFCAGGFHPAMKTMCVAWSIILCGGIAAGAWHYFKILSGKYDLIIDEPSGFLELPVTRDRKYRRRIALKDVQGVYVKTVREPSSDGESQQIRYVPTLILSELSPESEALAKWNDLDKAEHFVQWLQTKLP